MVQLVPFTESDFQPYMESLIKDYAQDHVAAGNFNPENAVDRARDQINRLLPNGLSTEGHYFNSIQDENNQTNVGILWFAVDDRGGKKKVFVYDVVIYKKYRRQGFGYQTFKVLEDVVHSLELDEISLHVFGHNQAARSLYEKLGFVEVDVILSKKLED